MTSLHSRLSRRRVEVPSHRYVIGELVRMKRGLGISPKTAMTFRVTAKLPPRDGSLQYRMRSVEETHERVTTEDNLVSAEVAAAMFGLPH